MDVFLRPKTHTYKYYIIFAFGITFEINVEFINHIVRENQHDLVGDKNLHDAKTILFCQETVMRTSSEDESIDIASSFDNMCLQHFNDISNFQCADFGINVVVQRPI